MSETVLDALVKALNDAQRQYPAVSEVAPLVVLWPDGEGQWLPLLPLLRARMPHLLTLGSYDLATRTGPAAWVRCAMARSIEVDWAPTAVPVVYLPGVARSALRAVDECPAELQLLVGMQYRGRIWEQRNGKDWTLRAFLSSADGVGLTIREDDDTSGALALACRALAEAPIASLKGSPLDGNALRKLVVADPERELLHWMESPEEYELAALAEAWAMLQQHATQHYGISPTKDGPTVAAARLCGAEGPWKTLWQRFVDGIELYPRLRERLHSVPPPTQLDFDARARYPSINAGMEDELRAELKSLTGDTPEADARARVLKLDDRHGPRRRWVWARASLRLAPLARALEHLVTLAKETAFPLVGSTPDAMAEAWTDQRWQVDAAALAACMAVTRPADRAAVHGAVRALYQRWLDDAARRFQERVQEKGFPGDRPEARGALKVHPGEVLFFADGLRYDVSRWLVAALQTSGLAVEASTRWIGMPSVTATSKPAASPMVAALKGSADGKDFAPVVASTGKVLMTQSFRDLLKSAGYQVLTAESLGDPTGCGFTEYGELDHRGHDLQDQLPSVIEGEIAALLDRITALLDAGWKRVRVVTDHGWLFLPGKLPKSAVDSALTEDKWGRCGIPSKTASHPHGLPTCGWRWNPTVQIVSAPGASVFYDTSSYSHGGMSLQECLTPDLWVSRASKSAAPQGVGVTWKNVRCHVHVASGAEGMRLDVRRSANDPSTSLADAVKPFSADGRAAVLIDHDVMGEAAHLVLLDAFGTVVHSQPITLGG